jgi:hypothetical protein
MNTSDLLASLGKVGKLFYDKMLERLNQGNYPHGESTKFRTLTSIQDATTVDSPQPISGGAMVEIKIDLKKAPYAGAYEEGSGEHGPKASTYTIKPRNVGEMVFPEDDWPNFVPGATSVAPRKGFFFLTNVEHPGVEKKPYISPTIAEVHDDVKKILARDFKEMLLRDGKPMEIIK